MFIWFQSTNANTEVCLGLSEELKGDYDDAEEYKIVDKYLENNQYSYTKLRYCLDPDETNFSVGRCGMPYKNLRKTLALIVNM